MKSILFAILAIAVFLPLKLHAEEQACSVGVVPQFEQRKILEIWSPLIEELSQRTDCTFKLMGNTSILEFEDSFKNGRFDFVYLNPYHAVIAKKAQGYEPLVRSGDKMLKGILVVKKGSSITSIEDLNGKKVAFPSPNALGASLLMRAELHSKGVDVIPNYVKTHSSVYLHVAKDLTLAGGGVARTLSQQPDMVKESLHILYETTPVPAHPFAVHPRIPKALQQQVQQAWLNIASQTPDLVANIPMKSPVTSTYEDYKILETMGLEDFVGSEE